MRTAVELTDGYKLGHRQQYPKGTQYVYSNWTARSNKYFPEAEDGVVVFGIQYLLIEYFIKQFNRDFFSHDIDLAVQMFSRKIEAFLGTKVDTEHIRELHKLGYLPIEVKALPEGTVCPIGVPMLTIINTDERFFWITNYLETIMSAVLWLPMTSATTARLYRKELERHAKLTGFDESINLGFLCHDFSMRGMAGLEAAITSGMAHLTSFTGTETIPAIHALEEYYSADPYNELIAATIPATEHSVMCAGGDGEDEFETFKRLITEVYPSGYISIVSDTWDFWKVMTDYLPRLKDEILARDGRVVIRPDSGDPVDIICGGIDRGDGYLEVSSSLKVASNSDLDFINSPEYKGAYELLWDTFGGTINEKGYKVLNDKVGIIYGDSITLDRQKEIYKRLEAKGFAATNLVLGIGSYTYQYRTRDSLGFAMKATWCQINGESKEIYKQPKTDDGTKNSLRGRLNVQKLLGKYKVYDRQETFRDGELVTVFKDGRLMNYSTLEDIRRRLDQY
jgi:nicotinamide phosphoribosyltransferase